MPTPAPQLNCPDADDIIEYASDRSGFYDVSCEDQHMRVALGSEETTLGALDEVYDGHDMYCVEYFRFNDMKRLNSFIYSRMYLYYASTLSGQVYVKNMHNEIKEDGSDVVSYLTGLNHVSSLSRLLNYPRPVGPVVFGTGVDCEKFTATRAVVLFVDQRFDPRALLEKLIVFNDRKIVIVSVANDSDIKQIYNFSMY